MVGLPFFPESSPVPIRAPRVEITFDAGGSDGGFGGLAAAAESLLGGGAAAWADYLVSLELEQALAPRVDGVELAIAQSTGAPSASLGDKGTIKMGPADALEPVFAGAVIGIERRGDGLRRYRLGNASHTLATARINQAVVNMTVQEAIAFGADSADVSLNARIGGDDAALAQYVFDDSRSVWEHLTSLAELRGFSLWIDAAGALQLADELEQSDAVQTFTYGEDLLAMRLWRRSPARGAITAFGGGRTDDGYTLRKQLEPNRAQGGDGPPQRFYRDGVLQSQDDLSARVASVTLAGHRRATTGEILVPGSAALGPGRVIELNDLPDGGGKFLILAARHTFSHRDGWRARLTVSEAGEVPGLGDALGALGGLL